MPKLGENAQQPRVNEMDFEQEIEWEEGMIGAGIARFRGQQGKAIESGRYTETSASNRLLKTYLAQVSEHISHYMAGNIKGVRRVKWHKFCTGVAADKLAMFGLNQIIDASYTNATLQNVAFGVGTMIEDELRFMKFELENAEYFESITDRLNDNNSVSYRHRKRVLVNGMNKQEVSWVKWSTEQLMGVGLFIVNLIMDSTDLVTIEDRAGKKRGFTAKHVVPTQELLDWIENHNSHVEGLLPIKLPMITQPDEWTDCKDGGYAGHRLKMKTPLVKWRMGKAGAKQRRLMDGVSMPTVTNAVNAMQNTSWEINDEVLNLVRRVWESGLGIGMPPSQPYEVPPSPIATDVDLTTLSERDREAFDSWKSEAREIHAMEKSRRSDVLEIARCIRMGNTLAEKDHLWYVYQLDFRGRIYSAASGISPQGSDIPKSLLRFSVAKPVGEAGAYWLKVHGANKFGYDKVSYDDRVKWVDDNQEQFLRAAADPISHSDVWSGADKPYQFLAFLFEYAGLVKDGAEHRSKLAIGLDGSCNGIQHFSAMLRDPVGGAAVNLVAGDKPADIYQEVADECFQHLCSLASSNAETKNVAQNWLLLLKEHNYESIPRKLAKKPVMTLPYGSTQQACTTSVYQWYIENGSNFFSKETAFRQAIFLSQVLWSAIKKVVIAARAAMDWMQGCASIVSKTKSPITYETYTGFRVYQESMKMDDMKIMSKVGGNLRIQFKVETDDLDPIRQRNGVSPNLVHSVDATHMQMCIEAGAAEGMTHFWMIHDDFGVHACDTERWHGIIREQFVKLHTEFNPLQVFKDAHEELVDVELPPSGDLDLSQVLESPYFFG